MKMMKYLTVFILFFTNYSISMAQAPKVEVDSVTLTPYPQNLIHFELGGNSGYLSLNYDRLISRKFFIRIGYGAWGVDEPGAEFAGAPVLLLMLNYFIENEIELGVGKLIHLRKADYIYDNSESFVITTRLAIRYRPHTGGFSYAFAYTPFFNFIPVSMRHSFGISFGYSF